MFIIYIWFWAKAPLRTVRFFFQLIICPCKEDIMANLPGHHQNEYIQTFINLANVHEDSNGVVISIILTAGITDEESQSASQCYMHTRSKVMFFFN